MKRNTIKGMMFISAIVLSSCSTQNKIASQKVADDDVYFTKAVAGDQPVYAMRQDNGSNYQNNNTNNYQTNTVNDNDYYYYDSYESRINRFYNYSPFLSSYNDDLYYGSYTPYYNGYSLGFGLGYGYYGGGYYGYSPFSYYGSYGGYGYNPAYGYSNYGYYGSTIGYGYSPYWGAVSYYNVARTYSSPRPYRGTGFPTAIATQRGIGYATVGGTQAFNPGGRPAAIASGNTGSTVTGYNGRSVRPTYTSQPQTQQNQPQQRPQPTYTPQPQTTNTSSGSTSSGSSSGGDRSSGSSRPVRP